MFLANKLLIICAVSCGLYAGPEKLNSDTPQKEVNCLYESHLRQSSAKEVLGQTTSNNQEVLDFFDRLSQKLDQEYLINKSHTSQDLANIYEAIEFASVKHQGQYRKNKQKTPYIIHPMGVAYQILDIANVSDPNVIKAALLHDTLEDTDATKEEISELFGEKVLSIVLEVTDDTTLPSKEKKLNQVKHAPYLSNEAALVKTSDRLYNLRDTADTNWSFEKKAEYFSWGEKLHEKLPKVSQELSDALKHEIEAFHQEG